ncbi:TraB/GumN family protein, partial [Streptomyces brasiliscabiei]
AVLASRFRAAHKQQAALETIHSQLALFDALSETEQRALLSATLADLANPARRYPATLAAWEAGRLAALADPLPQKLAERLVTERNR